MILVSRPLCAEIPPCAVDPVYRCFLSLLLFSPTPLADSRPPSRPSISMDISSCVVVLEGTQVVLCFLYRGLAGEVQPVFPLSLGATSALGY